MTDRSPSTRPLPDLGGRVVVLAGGLSHERDVSLRSGRRVSEALRHAGIEVEERDVDASLLGALRDDPPACVFPVLHGETGEDGSLQEVLELLEIPYVGSTPTACRTAFDKPVAKAIVARHGLHTPRQAVLPAQTFREIGAAAVMEALLGRLGLPLVVKPVRGGSALGCEVVRREDELPGAMVHCFSYGPVALVEQCVDGTEVAVAVIESGGRPQTLPAVEIRPDGGVYDYSARYTAGATEFVVPAALADTVSDACGQAALSAHRALGLRDLSRSDLIVDPEGTVWFLEVNVAPGMTETSLLPLALEGSGRELAELVHQWVSQAVARQASAAHARG
ncbi:MAG: D-alanine--D-alanine ligase family protein [Nocardioidaceae bacterium]